MIFDLLDSLFSLTKGEAWKKKGDEIFSLVTGYT